MSPEEDARRLQSASKCYATPVVLAGEANRPDSIVKSAGAIRNRSSAFRAVERAARRLR